MLREFREFALRGNLIDLAIGFILGTAFGAIVKSLVEDVIMPPLGLLLGRVDFSNLYVNLSGGNYASLAQAKQAGAATLNYGIFINTIINFVIVALVMFLLVRAVNRLQKPAPVPVADTKECPYCYSLIPLKATRCPHCTSQLA
jgi:large conductance mechanosensitive channel